MSQSTPSNTKPENNIKPKRNSKKKKPLYRLIIQIFFFSLVLLISINSILIEKGITIPLLSSASLHAICPFGGVVSIYQFITVGSFVQKIHESAFVLMGLALFLAIFFGPVICGWVCPLGSFQEWLSKIGKKLFKKRYNHFIPKRVDQVLRYTRYLLLAMVVYKTATTAKLMFSDIDPYYALFNFWSDEVSIMAIVILIITILLSLIVERPWCKYACPYGAVLGLTNFIRIFKIRRNPSTCVSCNACDNACPMNITVSKGTTVRNHQCISCMKCTSENHCPIDNTVEFSVGGQKNES